MTAGLTPGQVALLRRACRHGQRDRALRTLDDRIQADELLAMGLVDIDWRPLDEVELAVGIRHAVVSATLQGRKVLDEYRKSLA